MQRKLTIEETTWTGSQAQRDILREAMISANDDANINIRAMLDAAREWWLQHRPEGDQTVLTYSPQAYSNAVKRRGSSASGDAARILLAFFTFGDPKYARLSHFGLGGTMSSDLDRFADQTLKFFRSGATMPYRALLGLISDRYEGYRPSWRPGAEGYVVRSHIEIKRRGTALWMSERQDFTYDITIREQDEGLLFPFAHSICALSRANNKCIKLYSFTERDPDTAEDEPVDIIRGSVMAVSNTGPHWAGPIFIRRVSGRRAPMGHVEISELEALAQKDVQLQGMFTHFDKIADLAAGWPSKEIREEQAKLRKKRARGSARKTR